MKKSARYIIIITIFLVIFSVFDIVNAEENDFGKGRCYVKVKDRNWEDPPVENISLDIYETFYVKIELSLKVKCWPSLWLEGGGSTKTFEVVEGPGEFDRPYNYQDMKDPGWNETVIWKLRPTDNKYAGGYTPLKLFVQLKNISGYDYSGISQYEYRNMNFNLVFPRINRTIWEGYKEQSDDLDDSTNLSKSSDNQSNTSGFEIAILIISIWAFIILKKKNN